MWDDRKVRGQIKDLVVKADRFLSLFEVVDKSLEQISGRHRIAIYLPIVQLNRHRSVN